MIDAADRALMEETRARRDRGRRRRTQRSTRSSRSSDGWNCSTPSRPTRSRSCSARSAPPTARRRRSTTWSCRRSVRSRAPISPSFSRLRRVGSAGTDRRGRASCARPRDGSRGYRSRAAGGMRHGVGAVGRHRSDRDCGGARCARDRSRWRLSRSPRRGRRRGRHAPRSRRVASGGRPRPARGRAPDRRSQPSHAGPRAQPRARAGAVRSSDRAVPGRAPPTRGCVGGGGGARGDPRRGPRGSRTPTRRHSRRPSPDARRAPWPPTASRCSPASASPPSIRSTASSSGPWRSRGSSARPTRSSSMSDAGCSPRVTFRRSSSCDRQESQSDHGRLFQGRSRGVMPPPIGKNWRCA